VLMLGTGLVLWFPELLPRSWHWLHLLAVLVHPIAALTTIGLFIIHIYMGVALVRGGFSGIVRGDVTQGWARAHHRLWAEQVGNASARK